MRTKTKIGIFTFSCCLAIAVGSLVAREVFPSNKLEFTLRKAIEEKRGGTLNIQEVTPFKWDRLDIYTPYTSYKDKDGRTIDVDECHCHLVFTQSGLSVAITIFKRDYGDFATGIPGTPYLIAA